MESLLVLHLTDRAAQTNNPLYRVTTAPRTDLDLGYRPAAALFRAVASRIRFLKRNPAADAIGVPATVHAEI